jgi:hypothetical protein
MHYTNRYIQVICGNTMLSPLFSTTCSNYSTLAQFFDFTYACGKVPRSYHFQTSVLITQCLANLIEWAASRYDSQEIQKLSFCYLLSTSSVAFIIILFDDYRVTVNGLLFGLLGLGTYYFATFVLCSHGRMSLAPTQAASLYPIHQFLPPLALLIAVFVTGCWALLLENRSNLYHALLLVNPFLLVFNLAIVAIALTHGPLNKSFQPPQISGQHYNNDPSADLGLFAGLSALLNNITGRPGYSTALQIGVFTGTFLTAFLCSRIRLSPPWHWRSSTPFSLMVEEATSTTKSSSSLNQDQFSDRVVGSKHMPVRLLRLNNENCSSEEQESLSLYAHIGETLQRRQENLPATRKIWPSLTGFVCVVIVWIALVLTNSPTFSSGMTQRVSPSLDLDYQPKGDIDIVISMYKEETDSVVAMVSQLREIFDGKGRAMAIIIYVKNDDVDTAELENRLGATSLAIKRPNVGREGETYLYHILSRFGTLAAHTLFIQAHAHNLWEIRRRIEAYLVPNTGMLSLGFSGNTCQCNTCSDRWGWEDGGAVTSLYERVYNKTCSTALLSYKGQFIASARRLRGIRKEVYEDLHSALVDPRSWAHSEPYLRNRPDSMNAPYFGYTLERLWSILLQCSEDDVAMKCPTLLSGTRRGGDPSDCQCFDHVD